MTSIKVIGSILPSSPCVTYACQSAFMGHKDLKQDSKPLDKELVHSDRASQLRTHPAWHPKSSLISTVPTHFTGTYR